jgi:hypothetical protein
LSTELSVTVLTNAGRSQSGCLPVGMLVRGVRYGRATDHSCAPLIGSRADTTWVLLPLPPGACRLIPNRSPGQAGDVGESQPRGRPHRHGPASLTTPAHLRWTGRWRPPCRRRRVRSPASRIRFREGPGTTRTTVGAQESGCGTAITLISPLAASLAEETCPAVSVLNMS